MHVRNFVIQFSWFLIRILATGCVWNICEKMSWKVNSWQRIVLKRWGSLGHKSQTSFLPAGYGFMLVLLSSGSLSSFNGVSIYHIYEYIYILYTYFIIFLRYIYIYIHDYIYIHTILEMGLETVAAAH